MSSVLECRRQWCPSPCAVLRPCSQNGVSGEPGSLIRDLRGVDLSGIAAACFALVDLMPRLCLPHSGREPESQLTLPKAGPRRRSSGDPRAEGRCPIGRPRRPRRPPPLGAVAGSRAERRAWSQFSTVLVDLGPSWGRGIPVTRGERRCMAVSVCAGQDQFPSDGAGQKTLAHTSTTSRRSCSRRRAVRLRACPASARPGQCNASVAAGAHRQRVRLDGRALLRGGEERAPGGFVRRIRRNPSPVAGFSKIDGRGRPFPPAAGPASDQRPPTKRLPRARAPISATPTAR